MYVTTNSAMVWKRMADENQQSAKLLARISVGLLLMMSLSGAYAYTYHARYAELCNSINSQARTSESASVKKLGEELVAAHCS
jgi:hypothetical protein